MTAGHVGRILGPDGEPIARKPDPPSKAARPRAKSMVGSMDSYFQALGGLSLPSEFRARDPLANHAWVFAAASVIANAAAQARFVVFRETDAAMRERAMQAKSAGRRWDGPRKGRLRTAVDRHLSQPWSRRMRWPREKRLEVDIEHPFLDVIRKPNPYQTAFQLWLVSFTTYAVRGDIRWLMTKSNGERILPGEIPEEVWPLSPDLFKPIYETRDNGLLTGWEVRLPREFHARVAGARAEAGGVRRLRVDPHEVVRFYNPHPTDLMSSMSRIAAAASAVEMDMLAAASNRSLMRNDCVPRGVIQGDMPIDREDEDELREKWEERHQGAEKEGRTAFLLNGLTYTQTGLSPKDMQWGQLEELDRERILAVLGTPPSVVGLTEFTNYATALTQSAHFYDKTIGPMWRLFEDTLDGTVFHDTDDSTFGGFDVSGIDGLRAGQTEKIQDANQLSGQNLHVPPRLAFQLVGLEVDEYPGDEDALVAGLVLPVEIAIEEANEPPPEPPPQIPPAVPPPPGADPAADPAADPSEEEPPPDVGEEQAKAILGVSASVADGLLTSKQAVSLLRVLAPAVGDAKLALPMRRDADPMGAAQAGLLLAGFAPIPTETDIDPWEARAPAYVRTLNPWTRMAPDQRRGFAGKRWREYVQLLGRTESKVRGRYRLWVNDQRIVDYFDARHTRFTGLSTQRLIDRVRGGLEAGIGKGETIQELRLRIGHDYDVASSSYKTLQVARTETSGFLSGTREEMFDAGGFEEREWITSQDDVVRDSHKTYGEAGPRPGGFDYLTLVNATDGRLRYPGDNEAPAREVVNCRCFHVPI